MQVIYFILFFVFIALIILHRRIFNFISDRLNIPKSNLSCAQVVAKQDRDVGWHGSSIRPYFHVYRITFEFEDLKSIQLKVSGRVYNSLSVGSKGVLDYTGDRFRKFHAGKTLEEINHK